MKNRVAAMLLVCGILSAPYSRTRADEYVEGEVLVTFKPHVKAGDAEGALKRHALSIEKHYSRISAKRQKVFGLVRQKEHSTAQLMEKLKFDADIETVEPNYIRHIAAVAPNDPDFSKLWALKNEGQRLNGITGVRGVDTGFIDAWKLARPAGGEVVVGVADTGVDTTHPDLAENIWVNAAEIPGNGIDDDGNGFRDDVTGYDFASRTGAVTDSGTHGTHLAGTIAATGKNGTGIIGIQYRAKILPLQVSDDGDSMMTSAVLAAYDYAIDLKQRGVNIVAINASFGGTSRSSVEQNAVQALNDAGIILCAAAGNEGTNNDASPSYPASYPLPNIISVAALTPGNGLAGFSNYGATSVDLAAPGVNIYSAKPLWDTTATSDVKAGGTTYASAGISYAGLTSASGFSGIVYNCGRGGSAEFPVAVSGNVALIQRGGNLTFAQKLTNAKNAGAGAAIVYDNTTATLSDAGWSLGSAGSWIPAVQVTLATGQALAARSPVTAKVTIWRDTALAYQFEEGTSMAAPHVSGAVAFAALNFPAENVTQRVARILNNVTPVAALSGRTRTGGRLNLAGIVDTDHDGLADWWEMEKFGSLAPGPAADPDKDGFSNADEFLALTDPLQSASHLVISSITASGEGPQRRLVLEFPSVAERTYQVEWSPVLRTGTWNPLGEAITGTGDRIQVEDPAAFGPAQPSRFYRLRMLAE